MTCSRLACLLAQLVEHCTHIGRQSFEFFGFHFATVKVRSLTTVIIVFHIISKLSIAIRLPARHILVYIPLQIDLTPGWAALHWTTSFPLLT